MWRCLSIVMCFMTLSACISFKSKSQTSNITHIEPSEETIQKVEMFLDKALAFVEKGEQEALLNGRKLTEEEIKHAYKLGIKFPEKVRITNQFSFPRPQDKELLIEFDKFGFGSFFEGGRTNGYGIFIKSYFPFKASIICHELVHVKQMEMMGLRAFLKQYLLEALTYEYFDMPLEVEAFNQTCE